MINIRRTAFVNDFELKQLVELQNIVYAFRKLHFTTEGFEKWYCNNPLGSVLSYSAFDEDKMVANYSCVPTQMIIDCKVINGVHSMAVVTHPNYRGQGLFKELATRTYNLAKEMGYEFVTGVANENSFHCFMKYFPFTFIGKLDVKWGWGDIVIPYKQFSKYWSSDTLNWRLSIGNYYSDTISVYANYGKYPLIKTYLGRLPVDLTDNVKSLPTTSSKFRPFNLYVGIGADLSKGHYFDMPKFVKHSPFNLRFMDISTDKHLPQVNKNNIVFQLLDFDVI